MMPRGRLTARDAPTAAVAAHKKAALQLLPKSTRRDLLPGICLTSISTS